MEYRQLGNSGLRVPVLSFGTATFGGTTDFFSKWGNTDVAEARRLIDVSMENGMNFFDTANMYSLGASEEILGQALTGKRHDVLISTKATFPMGDNPNQRGSSRYHLIQECEASLKRLGTDYIDLYIMHGFDSTTPAEETLHTLEQLVQSGKVRYIGCSNFAAWQVVKSLSLSEKHHFSRYVVYQGYYSLIGRDYEWELMPMALEEKVGLMVWSPLGWGRLSGKIRRNQPLPEGRIKLGGDQGGPKVEEEFLYKVVDALDGISKETGKTVPQIALNWLLQKPTVCNIVIGARNEEQLRQNLGAVGWKLTEDQAKRLDEISQPTLPYPHWIYTR